MADEEQDRVALAPNLTVREINPEWRSVMLTNDGEAAGLKLYITINYHK